MQREKRMGRRQALTVIAGAGASAFLRPSSGRANMPTAEWRGRALGGPARIVIRDRDETVARKLVGLCVGEIERLERTFSLYRRDSEILHLNREGRLDDPSLDIRLLLSEAQRYGKLSNGSFDVTVQPLWRLYSRHFAGNPLDTRGPEPQAIDMARSLVDYCRIDLDNGRAILPLRGMEVTLNGLAQGYITDRVADLLRDAGLTNVLVDVGEIRVLDGDAWKIGVEDPRRSGQMIMEQSLGEGAVATSAGIGSRFDAAGRFHHLFDPRTGACADHCLSATAFAATAMEADALATTLAVSRSDSADSLVRAFRGWQAVIVSPPGGIVKVGA